MSGLATVVRGGMGRRRVQTAVVVLVAMISVTAAVLGGTLLVASHAPFDRAFGQQHGAHLTATFDAKKVTEARLTASAGAAGVAATAGPFVTVGLNPHSDDGRSVEPITVAGRPAAGGPVDDVTLVQGHWPAKPGEVVLALDNRSHARSRVGETWTLPEVKGTPKLTVVGLARSVTGSAGGWVTPQQAAALKGAGADTGLQMLYRFTAADTAARVEAGRLAVQAGLPAGAMTGSQSWLTVRQNVSGDLALFVPFLLAFGLLGLVLAVLVVGNVVAGAVSNGTRRIGVLKALGCTPAQVVRAYLAQALIPAAVGVALGVVVGNLLVLPVLAQTNDLYGTNDSGVRPEVDAAVAAGVLLVVAVTGWAAALRAGRLRVVDALAAGRTPDPGRGRWASRVAAALPLPRAVGLGLAQPFARPVRSLTTVAAVAFGAAAMTLAFGLAASLNEVGTGPRLTDVEIRPQMMMMAPPGGAGPGSAPGPGPREGPPQLKAADVTKVLQASAAVDTWVGLSESEVAVTGLPGSTQVLSYTGAASASAQYYRMISGRWFSAPGEIVVAKPFLTATRTKVGDQVVLNDGGKRITVRIVGEAFNVEENGTQVVTAAGTLKAAEPDLQPDQYNVTAKAGSTAEALRTVLNPGLEAVGAEAELAEPPTSDEVVVMNALAGLLSLLLLAAAGLGVLNTVLLETRDRVHELGVFKALGMTPRQTVAMVISSVVVTGVLGGLAGTAVGQQLQRAVLRGMADSVGLSMPAGVLDVYGAGQLVLFCTAGLGIAVLGALLPAGWAAASRTASALRTE